ncbi:FAD-binding molybdopterin dehydrogenase [Mycolicibacterium sp. CH28]|uniref:FAD binding domain-containing protein n=1 Tax=Mycolicibacterium sp. CH28 TaxID=2512237 RepID=UPI0010812A79|nr:FAD binding domain-containing protein [Mycolicibacterium sp. CH28]TGD86811.1 FAD-binding molybdopterin dehydrogenase [Mycolicibacterium sp. CH28]
MDIPTVEAVDTPTRRAEVWPLGPGDAVLAGGTWLFSEPQVHLRRLVDITTLGWTPITLSDNGIEIAATCTIEQLAGLSGRLPEQRPQWAVAPLFRQCASALKASFKVWKSATIGGNLSLSFPAGSMISLTSALDGEVLIWQPGGGEYRMPVSQFVTGAARNRLAAAEVIRSVHLPAAALRARTAYRKVAPTTIGRSGVVVIGRRDTDEDGGRLTISVTGATVRPYVFTFDARPGEDELRAAHGTVPDADWTDDAHGDPDWRAAMALLLARQVAAELA